MQVLVVLVAILGEFYPYLYIGGSVQDCSFSSVLAMKLLQSCTELSLYIMKSEMTFHAFCALIILKRTQNLTYVNECIYVQVYQNVLLHSFWPSDAKCGYWGAFQKRIWAPKSKSS